MSTVCVIDEQIPDLAEKLSALGKTIVVSGREITNTLLREAKATALFVRSTTKVDGALLDGTSIRFVASATAGTDHLDLKVLHERGIEVVSAPGSNAWAVVEFVIANLLELDVAHGSVIGIIGYGNIGSRLARVARHFGYDVLVNDPPLELRGGLRDGAAYRVVDLHTLCTTSDVVSIHTPLVTVGAFPTHHLLSAEHLASIRHGAVVINAARGGVLDERALVAEHQRGRLTAVLDVFENEPVLNRTTIEAIERTTPHIAGYSLNAKREGARVVYEAFMNSQQRNDREMRHPERSRQVASSNVTLLHLRLALREISGQFREQWLRDPTPATFDRIRAAYQLQEEELSTWAIFADEL